MIAHASAAPTSQATAGVQVCSSSGAATRSPGLAACSRGCSGSCPSSMPTPQAMPDPRQAPRATIPTDHGPSWGSHQNSALPSTNVATNPIAVNVPSGPKIRVICSSPSAPPLSSTVYCANGENSCPAHPPPTPATTNTTTVTRIPFAHGIFGSGTTGAPNELPDDGATYGEG